MSEQSSQEPTMEEILASIRRIISEDEAPPESAASQGEPGPAATSEPAPTEAPEPIAEPEPRSLEAPPAPPEPEEEPLELTQKVEGPGDPDFLAAPAAAPVAGPSPAPVAGAGLVSEPAASAAAAAFGQLSAAIAMPPDGRTLEDVVRELLTPLLQRWLDENLPGIVQEAVQAEVERIARSRAR